MSDVIRPKQLTLGEWLQGSKSFSKQPVQPKPEPMNMEEEMDHDSSAKMDFPDMAITPIDDGEEIDEPQIPSNQLGLLTKPASCALIRFSQH